MKNKTHLLPLASLLLAGGILLYRLRRRCPRQQRSG